MKKSDPISWTSIFIRENNQPEYTLVSDWWKRQTESYICRQIQHMDRPFGVKFPPCFFKVLHSHKIVMISFDIVIHGAFFIPAGFSCQPDTRMALNAGATSMWKHTPSEKNHWMNLPSNGFRWKTCIEMTFFPPQVYLDNDKSSVCVEGQHHYNILFWECRVYFAFHSTMH